MANAGSRIEMENNQFRIDGLGSIASAESALNAMQQMCKQGLSTKCSNENFMYVIEHMQDGYGRENPLSHYYDAMAILAERGIDVIPFIGDAKAFAEAETRLDYGFAFLGIIPFGGDAANWLYKGLKNDIRLLKADNIATYNPLKNQLIQQNLDNIAKQDTRLAQAIKGSGVSNPNFSIGMGTATDADKLGKIWLAMAIKL